MEKYIYIIFTLGFDLAGHSGQSRYLCMIIGRSGRPYKKLELQHLQQKLDKIHIYELSFTAVCALSFQEVMMNGMVKCKKNLQ